MTVYLITNVINGKKYVGQTIQKLNRRWRQHISDICAICKGRLRQSKGFVFRYAFE